MEIETLEDELTAIENEAFEIKCLLDIKKTLQTYINICRETLADDLSRADMRIFNLRLATGIMISFSINDKELTESIKDVCQRYIRKIGKEMYLGCEEEKVQCAVRIMHQLAGINDDLKIIEGGKDNSAES